MVVRVLYNLLLIGTLISFNVVGAPYEFNDQCSKNGTDSIKTITKITLYREFFKQKNFTDAVTHWRYVFLNAPGHWQSTYVDGVKMYTSFISKEEVKEKKVLLIDTLLMIYDQRIKCFDVGWGRRAHEMFKYRQSEVQKVLDSFDEAIEKNGNKTEYFLLQPYFLISLKALKKEMITKERVLEILNKISEIIESNISNQGKNTEKFIKTQALITASIPSKFLGCAEAKEIFEKKYNENPDDENLWKQIYNIFITADCVEDPLFLDAGVKYFNKEPDGIKAGVIAKAFAKAKRFSDAAKFLKKAIDLEDDNLKKAEYYFQLGELYRLLNDFPASKMYAQKAANLRSGWGKPYILLGDLYVSSGKLCGEGTGFDSQRVTWVAIDMYEKAKRVDPSLADEANKNIAYAMKYLPSKEQCFLRSLMEGDPYTVPCWINESTTVRFAKE